MLTWQRFNSVPGLLEGEGDGRAGKPPKVYPTWAGWQIQLKAFVVTLVVPVRSISFISELNYKTKWDFYFFFS